MQATNEIYMDRDYGGVTTDGTQERYNAKIKTENFNM